ncbi:MAG: adenylate/guanylate cyclase domain-containing protein [Chitinophagales bacterium]
MKGKIAYILLIILCGASSLSAQDRVPDSLKAALSVTNEDTLRVEILLNLSKYYLNSSTEEAKRYGIQALELAQKLKYNPGRALALKNLGLAYYFQGHTSIALDYYGQSLRVYDSIGDLDGKARILNNFGTVYYSMGEDVKSLDSYFKSLAVAEKIGDKAGVATAYSNIANVYHNKRATTDKSLDYFLKAIAISEEIGDNNITGAAATNLGEIYMDLNKDDSALFYYNKSMKAYANTIDIPVPLKGIALVYAKKGDFDNAIKYDQLSYQMARKFDSKLAMTQSLTALGDIYYKKGDYSKALAAYKEADTVAKIIHAYKELDDAYAGLAVTYSKTGAFSNAYKYQKLFSALADTLNNQTLSDKLANLQGSFEIQSRQNQINLLTKDKKLQELDLKSQKIQKTFITMGLVLILAIAGIILRNYLESAKVNKLLDAQKAQIETLLHNILPAEVATELKEKGNATPRYYESVSVLFTDFKGFTRHADEMSPQEIVSELNACFVAFDDIIDKYRLEKIKTIGDAYMCAGGIPTPDKSHAINMVKAGLEMVEHMKWRNSQRAAIGLLPWELRIGIHVGPVAAGVVGKKKYAYDIWGSTVNIARRMESNGEPGQVNISSNTYELIKDWFFCQYRGKISAKNIGEIDMYFVQGEINFAKPIQQIKAEA